MNGECVICSSKTLVERFLVNEFLSPLMKEKWPQNPGQGCWR